MSLIFKALNPKQTLCINITMAQHIGLQATVIYYALLAKHNYYESRNLLDRDGFFYCTANDMQASTSLGRKPQENAIQILTDKGLLECRLKGLPAKRHFRLIENKEALDDLLSDTADTDNSGNSESKNQETNKIVLKGQSCLQQGKNHAKQANAECAVLPNKIVQKGQTLYSVKIDNNKIDNRLSKHTNNKIPSKKKIDKTMLDEQINVCDFCIDDRDLATSVLQIMQEVIKSRREYFIISGERVPRDALVDRLRQIRNEDVVTIIQRLKQVQGPIKNMRAYLLKCIYEKPAEVMQRQTTKKQEQFNPGQREIESIKQLQAFRDEITKSPENNLKTT